MLVRVSGVVFFGDFKVSGINVRSYSNNFITE